MADNTTELEVLDQIVDVLGGQSGQYETVVPTLQQILALLGGGGGGGGYNPALSVGRADALTGADDTAQWATRESTGSGAATVRSVQGAAVAFNQLLPQLSNGQWYTPAAQSTFHDNTADITPTAQYGRLSRDNITFVEGHAYLASLDYRIPSDGSYSVYTNKNLQFTQLIGSVVGSTEWRHSAQILTATSANAGIASFSIQDNRASGWDTWSVKNIMLFDLTAMFGSGNEPTTVAEFERMFPASYYPYSAPTLKPVQIAGISSTDAQGGELDSVEWPTQTLRAAGSVRDELTADELVTRVGVRAYQSGDENDATVRTDGTTTYYPLATPTTTPISPALPMTYKVQAGGSESIIVPDGEISAAPVLTVAEGESASELVMDALACIATPDGPVATSSHAVNTYLTMQGKLYKVTSAIAVGETIKSGTNVSQTTVMAELIARTA